MSIETATIADVRKAEPVMRKHFSPAPLIRSYALERELKLSPGRQVWIKDFGWTPVGSFKLQGALNWMHNSLDRIVDRPVVAHSSGNFASGISFAGMRYKKKVIVVMPETAPKVKFNLTRSFGAEIRTFDTTTDHLTGQRDKLTRQLIDDLGGIQASPYDDNHVIAGNGVGGLEIVDELKRIGRPLSHFFCPVSGGGLMAGMALAIDDGFPEAKIIGVEPDTADDFRQSLAAGKRVRIEKPSGICDGLLTYDVGEHNWPILQKLVKESVCVPDAQTKQAMKWIYENHGLRTEPSGAISIAAALFGKTNLDGEDDIVFVLSGRNVDEQKFRDWIAEA